MDCCLEGVLGPEEVWKEFAGWDWSFESIVRVVISVRRLFLYGVVLKVRIEIAELSKSLFFRTVATSRGFEIDGSLLR